MLNQFSGRSNKIKNGPKLRQSLDGLSKIQDSGSESNRRAFKTDSEHAGVTDILTISMTIRRSVCRDLAGSV